MIVLDWHELPAPETARLYAAESTRWMRDLAWDTTSSWAAVERARTTWGLPGLICVDLAGAIRGWTFYLDANGRVDVGGLVADCPEATGALLDELVTRARSPHHISGFIPAGAPDVLAMLAARGIPYSGYSYRYRGLDARRAAPRTPAERVLARPRRAVRAWSERDIDATSALLHETYEGIGGPIGSEPTPAGWRTYVSNLAHHDGCGKLSPAMSRVVTIDGAMAAVALVSTIAPRTAHLVQLAVARAHQGGGVGRALLSTALTAARDNACTGLSLLVAHDNAPALRLYHQAGFVERGLFAALGIGREAAAAAARTA